VKRGVATLNEVVTVGGGEVVREENVCGALRDYPRILGRGLGRTWPSPKSPPTFRIVTYRRLR
jgi:hypothetical protein